MYPDKPELIMLGIKQQRNKVVDYFPIMIHGNDTSATDTVRMLCVVFDSDFCFYQYISEVCKSYFYHIRDFHRIQRHLSLSATKTIPIALINDRLDYCNSFLSNIAKNTYLNSIVCRIL